MEEHAPDRIQLKNHLSMELAYTEVVNYALQQNKLPVIQKLTLFNEGEDAIEELRGRFGKGAVTYAVLLGNLKMPTDGRDKVRMPGLMYQ